MGPRQRFLINRLETGVLFGFSRNGDGWSIYLGLWCIDL